MGEEEELMGEGRTRNGQSLRRLKGVRSRAGRKAG